MRLGLKTALQNTTWAYMLAVWREADDIELYESVDIRPFYPSLPAAPARPSDNGLARGSRSRSPP